MSPCLTRSIQNTPWPFTDQFDPDRWGAKFWLTAQWRKFWPQALSPSATLAEWAAASTQPLSRPGKSDWPPLSDSEWRHLNLYWHIGAIWIFIFCWFRFAMVLIIWCYLYVVFQHAMEQANYIKLHSNSTIHILSIQLYANNNHTLVRPCLTLRCRCPYIMLASLSRVTSDVTDSWTDSLLTSIVHDIFHIIPSAFQPPLVHSLMGLAVWTHFITFVFQWHSYRPFVFVLFLVLIFQDCRPCMSLALPGSDIYKHRLAERSPRNTHYAHSTPIRHFNDMKVLWKWTSHDWRLLKII